jgi:1,4-dihydroxy-2-naphthoate octaprenyltransferase
MVFLAWALASQTSAPIDYDLLILAFVGAILSHVSVNTFNEYFDFKSGLDQHTQATPFSGGSGALVSNLSKRDAEIASKYVLRAAIISALITFGIGAYVTTVVGLKIIPIGLLGLFIIVSYTSLLNKSPIACWSSPGLGFGPLMIVGTYFVLTGHYQTQVLLVSLLPMLLANNLLLLNQFPDVDADKLVGRRHVPIVSGLVKSAHLYGLTVLVSVILLTLLCIFEYLPWLSLIFVLPLMLGFWVYLKALNYAKRKESDDTHQISHLLPYMGINVAITLSIPLGLGLVVMFA